jgi:hypothetical protein
MRRLALTAGLGTLACAAALLAGALRVAQEANPHHLPEELQQFWRDYQLAKDADDEEGMDKAVRRNHERADRTLNILIDDYSLKPDSDMPDELRTLAFCLSRVDGSQRYIDRVRFVLELPADWRPKRSEGLNAQAAGLDLFNKAFESKSADDYAAAQAALAPVLQRWIDLGDAEQAVFCLDVLARCEEGRGRPAEQAAMLQQLVEWGGKLNYKDETVAKARLALEDLEKSGTTAAAGGGAAATEAGEPAKADAPPAAGAALLKFEAGSSPITLTLGDDKGEKGVGAVVLPGVTSPEQYLLWPQSVVTTGDPDPDPFDTYRAVQLKPFGQTMLVERDGSKFKFDTDGDGTFDLTVAPSSTPQRFELPGPGGKGFYPILLSVPADKEDMFGVATNYAPQKESARLRFEVGGALQGEALGSPWKVYDTNLTGSYGDAAVKNWDDGLTAYDVTLPHTWWDTDAVLVGKSKVAIPWSTALPVGEDFYRAEIGGPDGRTLTLQKLALETGLLKLDMATAVAPTHLVLCGTGSLDGAFFNVVPAKKGGTVKLPVGSYTIAGGRIESGKKTSMKLVRIYQGTSGPIEIKAGETTTLALGAPYKLKVATSTEEGSGVIVGTSIRIFGRGGEEYALLFDDPLQPDVEVRGKGNRKIVKGERMARAGVEEWQRNETKKDNALWFPVNYVFELPAGESFQVRLTQEKQPLLGGPFDSDWTP